MSVYKVQAEGGGVDESVRESTYHANLNVRDSESVAPLLRAVNAVKGRFWGEIIIGIPCVTSVSDANSVMGMQGESFDQGISADFNLQHGGKKNILNQVINEGLAGVKLCLLPCAAVKACEQGNCIVYSATDLGTEKSVEPLQTFIDQGQGAGDDVYYVLVQWSGQYDFFPFTEGGVCVSSESGGSATVDHLEGSAGDAFTKAEEAITDQNWNAVNCQPMLSHIEGCQVRTEQLLKDVPELDFPKSLPDPPKGDPAPPHNPYATVNLMEGEHDKMCRSCFSCFPS